MTTTHTPGQWYTALLPNMVIARPRLGDDAVAVASVGGRSRDECEANARLIALAPEMAELVRKIASRHSDECAAERGSHAGNECWCGCDDARALLARLTP